MRKVAALNCVEDLVGLLQRVLTNCVEGLLAIPRATTRRAQPGHEGGRLLKKSRGPHRIGRECGVASVRRRLWTVCVSCNVHPLQFKPATSNGGSHPATAARLASLLPHWIRFTKDEQNDTAFSHHKMRQLIFRS